MRSPFHNPPLMYLFAVLLALGPLVWWGGGEVGVLPHQQLAATAGDFLRPEEIFRMLRENMTIPIPFGQEIEIKPPQEAVQEISPQLKGFNKEVREEVGIDFAKLTSWFARVLRYIFDGVINIFEGLSQALGS